MLGFEIGRSRKPQVILDVSAKALVREALENFGFPGDFT